MAGFSIRRFAGEPLGLERSGNGLWHAHRARDADFSAGTLRPLREDRLIRDLAIPTAGSIWADGCCIVAGDQCETIVSAHLPCERHFRVRNGVLEHTREPCGVWTPLGHPCITQAPSLLTSRVQTEGKVIARQFVYAVINDFDEIEAVSPPTNVVVGDWDRDATVYDIVNPLLEGAGSQEDLGHRRIRLYGTGPDQALAPNAAPSDIHFFSVAEVGYGSDAVAYTVRDHPFGEALVPEDYSPPPDGLTSLAHWGGRQLAGLADGKLCFSLPNNYAAWPGDSIMAFEDEPIAFVAGRDRGYVLTCGRPVSIDLTRDCRDGRCHAALTIPDPLPLLAPRSAAIINDGVVFASRDGLVYLQGDRWVLLTAGMTREEWMSLRPERARGIVHKGTYFFTTDLGTWRLRLPGNPFDPTAARPDMTRLSTPAEAWYRSMDGRLFLSAGAQLLEWAEGTKFHDTIWESEPIQPGSRVRWVYVQCSRDAQYSIEVKPYHGASGLIREDRSIVAPFRSGPGWAKLPSSVDRTWWTLRVVVRWGEVEALTLTTSRNLSGAR